MPFKTVISWKGIATLLTLKWFTSSVCFGMSLKIILPWECIVTLAALIWFIPIVCSYMTFKVTLSWDRSCHIDYIGMAYPQCLFWYVSKDLPLGESLAHWPYWNGLSPVCSGMTFKISLLWEGLVTLTTLKWFIPYVCSGMLQKTSLLCESFITLTSLIWFIPVCVLLCLERSPLSSIA